MNNQDKKRAAKLKGWAYIVEGLVMIAAALFLLWLGLTAPLLPVAIELFFFVALLIPAAWFLRAGKRALDEANEL
jgi:hypothetical protein